MDIKVPSSLIQSSINHWPQFLHRVSLDMDLGYQRLALDMGDVVQRSKKKRDGEVSGCEVWKGVRDILEKLGYIVKGLVVAHNTQRVIVCARTSAGDFCVRFMDTPYGPASSISREIPDNYTEDMKVTMGRTGLL